MIKRALLAGLAMFGLATTARADIVLVGPGDILSSFIDVGAQGFGNFHRALTLQNNGIEFGSRGFGNAQVDEAINGADKGNTPTLAQLQWNSGANVGIGFNSNQTGGSGITMDALRLTVWNTAGTIVFSAGLAVSPINFTQALLALQQGNGNAVFDFELNAAERTLFNTMLSNNGGINGAAGSFTVGLASILGCGTTAEGQTFNQAGCMSSNDGADSFVLFSQAAAVPGPVVGAGLPGMLAAALALVGFGWRRRTRLGLTLRG